MKSWEEQQEEYEEEQDRIEHLTQWNYILNEIIEGEKKENSQLKKELAEKNKCIAFYEQNTSKAEIEKLRKENAELKHKLNEEIGSFLKGMTQKTKMAQIERFRAERYKRKYEKLARLAKEAGVILPEERAKRKKAEKQNRKTLNQQQEKNEITVGG